MPRRRRTRASAFAAVATCLLAVSACSPDAPTAHPAVEPTLPQATPLDTSYPNNWRPPELTSSVYRQPGNAPCPESDDDYSYVDPLPVILHAARDHRVVMINESHYKPLHRVFVGQLASALEAQGTAHFGSEMLGDADSDWLNSAATLSSARLGTTYSHDPVWGQIAENLMGSDLTLFSYERGSAPPPPNATSALDHREETQAANIAAWLDAHSGDRVLIHAGYAHIKERDAQTGTRWMAERLVARTGLDPLTISQTDCVGTQRHDGTLGYGLLVDADGNPVSRNGVDMILAMPPDIVERERPTWLRDVLDRRFADVPDTLRFDGPTDYTLLTARRVDSPDSAPPEDVIYRAPGSDKALALRPGRYTVRVTDRDKAELARAEMTVR